MPAGEQWECFQGEDILSLLTRPPRECRTTLQHSDNMAIQLHRGLAKRASAEEDRTSRRGSRHMCSPVLGMDPNSVRHSAVASHMDSLSRLRSRMTQSSLESSQVVVG